MFRWLRRIISFIVIAHIIYLLALKFIFPPITLTQLQVWTNQKEWNRKYVSYQDMSPHIKWAVIASEDQKFASHNGFDIPVIKKLWKEKNNNKKLRGGSTISQQTAKNVFLWQKRSWIRKGLEVYFTILIEWVWGKERILEIYLNSIEMGPGVFGIEAASQKYFNKSAKNLNAQEAAQIAAVLPNPKVYKAAPPSPYIQKRSTWILSQVKQHKSNPDLEKLID